MDDLDNNLLAASQVLILAPKDEDAETLTLWKLYNPSGKFMVIKPAVGYVAGHGPGPLPMNAINSIYLSVPATDYEVVNARLVDHRFSSSTVQNPRIGLAVPVGFGVRAKFENTNRMTLPMVPFRVDSTQVMTALYDQQMQEISKHDLQFEIVGDVLRCKQLLTGTLDISMHAYAQQIAFSVFGLNAIAVQDKWATESDFETSISQVFPMILPTANPNQSSDASAVSIELFVTTKPEAPITRQATISLSPPEYSGFSMSDTNSVPEHSVSISVPDNMAVTI